MRFSSVKDRDFLIVLLFFIAIVLVKVVLSLPFPSPGVMMDEVDYANVAQNILHGKLYTTYLSQIGVTTPPGYSIFLSVAYLFSNKMATVYHIMLAVNAIITASIIFPSYFILNKYCSRTIAILGSLAVSTLPIINLFPYILLSENLFIPLFAFSAWFLVESYEENSNKIWEFLASLSVVLLYMTRSTGISMLAGFCLAFAYYSFVNRKEKKLLEIIREKKVLLISFIVLLSLWLAYSTFLIPSGSYSMGNPYNLETSYTARAASAITNTSVLIPYLVSFVREMDYLIIATYFFLLFVVYYYIKAYIDKRDLKSPIMVAFFYFAISSLGLITISTTYLSYYYNQILYEIYGRYIEPIIPLLFIFGILGLTNVYSNTKSITKKDYKKWALLFSIYTLITVLVIYTIPLKNYNIVNTLSIYYLYVIYNNIINYVLIFALSILIFLLFILPLVEKRYAYFIIILFIFISIIFSLPIYRYELLASDTSMDNIVIYFQNHSSNNAIVLVDNNIFNSATLYDQSEAYFWFKGNVFPVANIQNSTLISEYKNDTIYVISQKEYPYRIVATGSYGLSLYVV
jgi:hypothetical protein